VKVTQSGETITAAIENKTGQEAKNLQLVVGDHVFPVGDLKTGEAKKLTLTRQGGTDLSGLSRRRRGSFMTSCSARQYAFRRTKRGQIPTCRTPPMAASFIRQAREFFVSQLCLPQGWT